MSGSLTLTLIVSSLLAEVKLGHWFPHPAIGMIEDALRKYLMNEWKNGGESLPVALPASVHLHGHLGLPLGQWHPSSHQSPSLTAQLLTRSQGWSSV